MSKVSNAIMHFRATNFSRPHSPLVVKVERDAALWVASCDALHLVTEADSYDALRHRVWEVAPELAELNGVKVEPKTMKLQFVMVESAQEHLMAL